ncbi:GAF domain-containing protein [Terriglobus roseus]|uniref:GAF domain-containing protein n=1 Tax=Terriglobus roseus TaxID=392734 RepID=A0A1H4JHC2_9BACT|nr:GAF domain-containing protein [Terriglobus roseus]SEB45445.1 GAF domain-containing protein [Terriglobus roseus]
MTDEVVVDLEACAREPIHIPGAIQPHGLLFVLREPELIIAQVSENAEWMLGKPVDQLLGKDISSFLDTSQIAKVRFALDSVDPRDNNPVELGLFASNTESQFDGFVHRHDGFSYLELEAASLTAGARFLDFYKRVSHLTSKLHATSSLAEMLRESTQGIRSMTGFDRVMIYRFAESNEGEVVAETVAEGVDSFLGLWYPASDIPEQARRLYLLNPIRNIVDVDYTPAAIIPVINPDSGRPADLSFAALRSVSPTHCEYLKNMGVAASMSVSIILDGRLWGLIACHHQAPKFVSYEVRKACTFIGQVLSGEISRRETLESSAYQSHATSMQASFLELMAGSANPLLGLVNYSPTLLDLIPADGVAVVLGEKTHLLGTTPGYDDLMQLIRQLQSAGMASTFVTRSLKNHFPLTEAMRDTASGLIALLIQREPATYIFFFRSEVARTVLWGGNPEKPVVPSDDGFRVGPRKSFEAWKEQMTGQSLPWSKNEIRAAQELRNLVTVVMYGK